MTDASGDALLDASALEHNLDIVRRSAGSRLLIASVKANGYGLGVTTLSTALYRRGVTWFWTGNISEARAIRSSLPEAHIILFGSAPETIVQAALDGFTPTIHDRAGIVALEAIERRPSVMVKVDAGLRRLGFQPADVPAAIAAITKHADIFGIYSHLPFVDNAGQIDAAHRADQFFALIEDLPITPPLVQLWGTGGLLSDMPDKGNAICVGHALIGLSKNTQPVARRWTTELIHVGDALAPATGSFYLPNPTRYWGVVNIGLRDGIRRPAPGEQAFVLIEGKLCPIIGYSLEHMMIALEKDVGHPGTTVALIDEPVIGIGHWSKWWDCSPLEVLISLSGRVDWKFYSW